MTTFLLSFICFALGMAIEHFGMSREVKQWKAKVDGFYAKLQRAERN